MKYQGQQRRCYVCRRWHPVKRIAPLALVGGTRVEVEAFLCSHECWTELVFTTPPEISKRRRDQAIEEMVSNK